MPKVNGIAAISTIRTEFPHARIIVLTTAAGDVQAVRAFKAGSGRLSCRNLLRKELVETIRLVHHELKRSSSGNRAADPLRASLPRTRSLRA